MKTTSNPGSCDRPGEHGDHDKLGVIAVVGATATGKTAVGVELALALNGEVVNGDSRLFYRGMDIATAKPSRDEMQGVLHHLVDILDPDQQFSLSTYLDLARPTIDDIVARGKLPIIVGGSGQYVRALLEGWDVPEIEPDRSLRAELEKRLDQGGVGALAQELSSIAPEVARDTDLLNPRRVIRAIERARSNSSSSVPVQQKPDDPPYQALTIGLRTERSVLHRRILARLDQMLERGWRAEVESLLSRGYSAKDRALSGIGYRQMVRHIAGEIDLDETLRLTAVATNRLVRNQGNWFKQDDPRIRWFDMTDDTGCQVGSIVETARKWTVPDS